MLTDRKRGELEARVSREHRDYYLGALLVLWLAGWVSVVAGVPVVGWTICGALFVQTAVRYVRRELALGALMADEEERRWAVWTLGVLPDARAASGG